MESRGRRRPWVLSLSSFLAVIASASHVAAFGLPLRALPHNRVRLRRMPLGGIACRDATAPLIEGVTVNVLKFVLRAGEVGCNVQSTARDLIRGRLKAAKVDGRRWVSPLGLTCREIGVEVRDVIISMPSLVWKRQVEFVRPAEGTAVVEFDARDFGHFLVHPFVRQTPVSGGMFTFNKGFVVIDPVAGSVQLRGAWKAHTVFVTLEQEDPLQPLRATVSSGSRGEGGTLARMDSDVLAAALARFFNRLVVDLDGPAMQFSSMSFAGAGVSDGRVRLTLDVLVPRLPSVRRAAQF